MARKVYNNTTNQANKLYSYENCFENFENLTEDSIEMLNLSIENQKERHANRKKTMYANDLLDFHTQIMNMINHEKRMSFDEKLYILITACDPDLRTLELYQDSDIISVKEVKLNPDLADLRKSQISELASSVRSEIGFYDPKLIKYERVYFNKFLNIFNNDDIKRKILGN